MLWGNTAYRVKLSGQDLMRYSNKNESVSLRKCPYYHYLTKSDVTTSNIFHSSPHIMAKQLA